MEIPEYEEEIGMSDLESDSADDVDDVAKDDEAMQCGQCPICLLEFTNQFLGVPNNCEHVFCLSCVQEWAKNMNTCPVDRKVFCRISVKRALHGITIKEIKVNDRTTTQVHDEFEDSILCEICARGDGENNMLLCDQCNRGFHMDCLSPSLDAIPDDDWFCADCTHSTFAFNTEHHRSRQGAETRATPVRRQRPRPAKDGNHRKKKSKIAKHTSKKSQRKNSKQKTKNEIALHEKIRRKSSQYLLPSEMEPLTSFSLFGNNDVDYLPMIEPHVMSSHTSSRVISTSRSTSNPDILGSIFSDLRTLSSPSLTVGRDGKLRSYERSSGCLNSKALNPDASHGGQDHINIASTSDWSDSCSSKSSKGHFTSQKEPRNLDKQQNQRSAEGDKICFSSSCLFQSTMRSTSSSPHIKRKDLSEVNNTKKVLSSGEYQTSQAAYKMSKQNGTLTNYSTFTAGRMPAHHRRSSVDEHICGSWKDFHSMNSKTCGSYKRNSFCSGEFLKPSFVPFQSNAESSKLGQLLTEDSSLNPFAVVCPTNDSSCESDTIMRQEKRIMKVKRKQMIIHKIKYALKKFYRNQEISKEDYKYIYGRAFEKVSKSSHAIVSHDVAKLIMNYVKKLKGRQQSIKKL